MSLRNPDVEELAEPHFARFRGADRRFLWSASRRSRPFRLDSFSSPIENHAMTSGVRRFVSTRVPMSLHNVKLLLLRS